MNIHENPVVVAIILPVEFCVLVLLELQGVRDEKLSRSLCDNRFSLLIKQSPNLAH